MSAKAVWAQQILPMCSSLPWQTAWIGCCGRAALKRKYFLGWCYLRAPQPAEITTPHLPDPLKWYLGDWSTAALLKKTSHQWFRIPPNGSSCNVVLILVVLWFNYAWCWFRSSQITEALQGVKLQLFSAATRPGLNHISFITIPGRMQSPFPSESREMNVKNQHLLR